MTATVRDYGLTGEALRRPATDPITLYDVAVRNGRVVSRLSARQQAAAP